MENLDLAPFGNPDGSRATIEDVLDGFVEFEDALVWGGLAMRSNDRTARVIIGRKGSGKTVYLRRLQAATAKDRSLYADVIQQDLPQTEAIIEFCQLFPGGVLIEKWIELWRRAIFRSVVTHLLYRPELNTLLPQVLKDALETAYEEVLPKARGRPVSVYSQVTQIAGTFRTYNAMNGYLNHPLWNQLEYDVAEAVRASKPICLFLDALDEEFEHAPSFWLRCQLGLFHATMRLLRDARLGGRLHLFIAIRDSVFSAALQSEHRSKYINEPHIRFLNWNAQAAAHFLQEKVKHLPVKYVEGKRKATSVREWLGLEAIRNANGKVHERVGDYILRHTRLLPRDVVLMGNRICALMAQHTRSEGPEGRDGPLARAVHEIARVIAEEQLRVCANEISAGMMPSDAARRGYADMYTSDDNFITGIFSELRELIATVGRDRFGRDELEALRGGAEAQWKQGTLALAALWRSGLLGYVEGTGRTRAAVFFSEDRHEDFTLPLDRKTYIFHACLLDAIKLRSIGKPIPAGVRA